MWPAAKFIRKDNKKFMEIIKKLDSSLGKVNKHLVKVQSEISGRIDKAIKTGDETYGLSNFVSIVQQPVMDSANSIDLRVNNLLSSSEAKINDALFLIKTLKEILKNEITQDEIKNITKDFVRVFKFIDDIRLNSDDIRRIFDLIGQAVGLAQETVK